MCKDKAKFTHFYDDEKKTCFPCSQIKTPNPTQCNKCEGKIHCVECKLGYNLMNGACCKVGEYYKDSKCSACHKRCRTCVGPFSTDCTGCKKGRIFFAGFTDKLRGSCKPAGFSIFDTCGPEYQMNQGRCLPKANKGHANPSTLCDKTWN